MQHIQYKEQQGLQSCSEVEQLPLCFMFTCWNEHAKSCTHFDHHVCFLCMWKCRVDTWEVDFLLLQVKTCFTVCWWTCASDKLSVDRWDRWTSAELLLCRDSSWLPWWWCFSEVQASVTLISELWQRANWSVVHWWSERTKCLRSDEDVSAHHVRLSAVVQLHFLFTWKQQQLSSSHQLNQTITTGFWLVWLADCCLSVFLSNPEVCHRCPLTASLRKHWGLNYEDTSTCPHNSVVTLLSGRSF